ncbi:sugar transporter [Cryptococcus neoformans Bt1]|nr:sugar transporter [Cryptococcus neoformans var. grubii Bt1]OXG11962.1 sugar transporter [Cryptococcus neoformans var. grubii Ze90-1]
MALHTVTPVIVEDEKIDIEHVEDAKVDNDFDPDLVIKSPFEDLSFFVTLKTFKKATFLALLAAFSAAADGYQIAMTGSIIANKGFIKTYGTAYNSAGELILDANVLAAWGGVQSAGQGFGMLSMHFIADKFGRKWAFYGLWLALVVGVTCETVGRHWQVWLVAKLASGYGVGSVQFLTGTYITEIVPSRTRGFILIFYSIWYAIGQLFASAALKVLADQQPYNFLDLIYTEWAMIGIMIMVYLYLPESPWWCANHDKHDRGRAIVERLNGGIEGYDVDFHYSLIKKTVDNEKAQKRAALGADRGVLKGLWDCREVFTGANGFRTLVAFYPAAIQQMSGLAVLSNYSSYFAQVAGFSDPFVFSLLLAIVGIIITILICLTTDFIGRRAIFLGAVVVTWCMLIIVGGMGLIKNPSHGTNQLVLFFSLVWRMSSTCLGTLGWSYVAETGSGRLRAITAGVSAAGGVAIGTLFSTTVPYMLNANYANWGLKTCFFFAGVSAPMCVAAFFIMPDTSKRTPAELDEMFQRKIKPWRFRSYVSDAQKALQAEKERTGETDAVTLQNATNRR